MEDAGSSGLSAPVVAFAGLTGSDVGSSPLVVLLHGRGSNERDIAQLVPQLPAGPAYAAVRAPIAEGGGFAWFANRGIGRPVAESLRETMDWFTTWLDTVAPPGRPVLLVGFSGGAAFAGGLVLDRPDRYSGAAVLYGTLPFDAGVPITQGRLTGLPVLVVHGAQDTVIPRQLLDRTWAYLVGAPGRLADSGGPVTSGADVRSSVDPGGHGISSHAQEQLARWLTDQLTGIGAPPP